jgi:isopentenyl diphosphate isomerase/L-lactate dehydrogenase-like FMN-dependent dehydrogenase
LFQNPAWRFRPAGFTLLRKVYIVTKEREHAMPRHAKDRIDPNLIRRHRREFLKFVAASPLFAKAFEGTVLAQGTPPGDPKLTFKTAKEVLEVMDFQDLARQILPPAHWGYMASGVDDNATYRANIDAYTHIELRPRRLVDVSKVDHSIELFGVKYDSPIFLCPVGGQRMFHNDGELATGRASKAKNVLQILSTQTSIAVEDVAKARGTAPWYQLYMPTKWEDGEKLVKRAQDAGCQAIAWTIDNLAGRNLETAERFRREDSRDCLTCHTTSNGGRQAPMLQGLGRGINPLTANWELFDKLRKATTVKLLLKGVETGEDAKMALDRGVDALIVSNHGGRATEDLRPTIQTLPEVIEAVGHQIPVLVDGGVRRGSSAFKALAMGARAVGIGRPYVWGLTAFGQDGIERVLDILRAELNLTMRQCGTPTIAQITRNSVAASRL